MSGETVSEGTAVDTRDAAINAATDQQVRKIYPKREKELYRLYSTFRDVSLPLVQASSSSKASHGISDVARIKSPTSATSSTSLFTSVHDVLFQGRVNKVIGELHGAVSGPPPSSNHQL